MEEVFLREYTLSIGRESELIQGTIPDTLVTPGGTESTPSLAGGGFTAPDGSYQDFLVKNIDALTITDLRITATTLDSKKKGSNKNVATIEIYNLTKVNQNLIRTDDTVLLRAGYKVDGTELPLIYAGQITKATTTKKGEDTITKIVCRASEVGRKNIRISKKPSRGETSETVANYFAAIAADNGIPTGRVRVPDPISYPSGLSLVGNFFTTMEEWCSKITPALSCYVTLGKLYIEPEDTVAAVASIEVQAENIKGSIRPQKDSAGKSSKDSKQGIELTLFLDGRVTTAKSVTIKFGEFRGDYNVTTVKFKLDSEGSAWDTIVSCTRR
jgi:hypothetical protein